MNKLEFLKNIKLPKIKRPSVGGIIFWALTLALAFGAFVFTSGLTACWSLTKLPGRSPATCLGGSGDVLSTPQVNEQGTPIVVDNLPPTPGAAVPESLLPAAWDGASRINILFIGLDFRDWQANEGPPRSDTMILFTVDPVSKTAGMLSVPRDLWVNIPGSGYGRINTAYSIGEANKLPGGGPGLAMKTVEQVIGVPIQYYVQVDFVTFVELADMFGCIIVHPQETIILDPIGPGLDHVKITGGGHPRQLCGGWKILAYARTRKTEGGDADRAARQQEVLFALREKIFDPEVFPGLIARAPEIYARLSSGIHTNMSLDEAIKLAMLGREIPTSSIKAGVIDKTMVTPEHIDNYGGQPADVLKPIADKIRVLRDEIFTTSGAVGPLISIPNPNDITPIVKAMTEEGARVRVLDGTFTGLEQRAGAFFQGQGMNVTEIGTATEPYSQSVVILYGPKLYTLKYLVARFGFSNAQIRFEPNPNLTVDIEIRIGSDLAGSIP